MSLSVVVITNKKKLDNYFLERLRFGDELLVEYCSTIDSFASVRNEALLKAKGDWVLFIDDDEVVSKELATEIKIAVKSKKYNGFYLKRVDTVFNKALSFGEVGNIKILRLARKAAGRFTRDVHEVWDVVAPTKILNSPLYHIKNDFISGFIKRISLYGPIDAVSLNSEKKHYSVFKLIVYPVAKFVKNYIIKKGYADGTVGLFLSFLMSVQSLSTRVFQWEHQKS